VTGSDADAFEIAFEEKRLRSKCARRTSRCRSAGRGFGGLVHRDLAGCGGRSTRSRRCRRRRDRPSRGDGSARPRSARSRSRRPC
jgi:hypothetical protein